MVGLEENQVLVVPFDNIWKSEFEKEKEILLKNFSDFVLEIEHIGSTSVPNTYAKPIIDIALKINNDDLYSVIPTLNKLGYSYKDSIVNGEEIFVRIEHNGIRTHHLHIVPKNSYRWGEWLFFREFMKTHPKEKQEYETLKKELAIKYKSDRKLYTQEKNDFISNILKQYKN